MVKEKTYAGESAKSSENIRLYLDEIGKYEIMSAEEEKELFEKYKNGDKKTAKEARDEIITRNLKLVVYIAKKYNDQTNASLEDLIQEGNIGLIHAVDAFDASRGFRFSTFATYWIRKSVTDVIKNCGSVRIPYGEIEKYNKWFEWKEKIFADTGKYPDEKETEKYCNGNNINYEYLCAVRQSKEVVSLNADLYDFNDVEFGDTVEDPDQISVEKEVTDSIESKEFWNVASSLLNETELKVLKSRYRYDGEKPPTYSKISRTMGLSRSAIAMAEKRAMSKLRDSNKFCSMYAEFYRNGALDFK